jgi:hypothetical protein
VKNPRNSTKLYLGKIMKNINLDGITCMQKFEDPLQVPSGPKLRNLEIWILDFKIETRVCNVACTVTPRVSQ